MPKARTVGHRRKRGNNEETQESRRFLVTRAAIVLAMLGIAARLFVLQVMSHEFYAQLADSQHSLFEELNPVRGSVFFKDPKSPKGVFPAAINRPIALVFADPRLVQDPAAAAATLAPILGADEETLLKKLSRKDDPYEPLGRVEDDEKIEALKALELAGVGFSKEYKRFYPDKDRGSHLLGFVGSNERGEKQGRYGVEGYWDDRLAGKHGFLESAKDPFGRLIGAAQRRLSSAEDGASITLTIDRTVQFVACEKLKQTVARHGAAGGTVIIMDPKTGDILADCSEPSFDPNTYSQVGDVAVFNNPALFTPYEPGSVFKAVTMAAAIDAGEITPTTTYIDEGSVKIGPYTIKNSDGKARGLATMTKVLEDSLNTGTIYAVGRLGTPKFRDYVHAFGFGEKFGVEADTEVSGNVASLDKRGDIWSATASFGQGITVTPLQMLAAYAAIANGGVLMQPRVVESVTAADGKAEYVATKELRRVVSRRTASLVAGMLVNVVENGHGKRAGVPGYYVAGKTGTAQIPRKDGQGYEKDATIGSFVGFAPADDPAFVMLTKIDRPSGVDYAEATAAPLFGEIADFLLDYKEIPPER